MCPSFSENIVRVRCKLIQWLLTQSKIWTQIINGCSKRSNSYHYYLVSLCSMYCKETNIYAFLYSANSFCSYMLRSR
jgi:hypothetical protein